MQSANERCRVRCPQRISFAAASNLTNSAEDSGRYRCDVTGVFLEGTVDFGPFLTTGNGADDQKWF